MGKMGLPAGYMHVDGQALCQLWICISIAVFSCGDHFICTSLVAYEWFGDTIELALAQKRLLRGNTVFLMWRAPGVLVNISMWMLGWIEGCVPCF